jgi:hypothetical protein
MIQHDGLMFDFFGLQLGNLAEVGDALSNLVELSVEIGVSLFQFLNLLALAVCEGSPTASTTVPTTAATSGARTA